MPMSIVFVQKSSIVPVWVKRLYGSQLVGNHKQGALHNTKYNFFLCKYLKLIFLFLHCRTVAFYSLGTGVFLSSKMYLSFLLTKQGIRIFTTYGWKNLDCSTSSDVSLFRSWLSTSTCDLSLSSVKGRGKKNKEMSDGLRNWAASVSFHQKPTSCEEITFFSLA